MAKPTPAPPARVADPVRLAAARAYASFQAGGTFRPTAPPALREPQQRRLYAQLLRGMVRHSRWLELEAARLARRPAAELSAPVMAALVLGLYQVLLLQQADHAAVFETVELLSALGQARAKGLVNAVLRSALRERARAQQDGPAAPPPPAYALAQRTSHPDWLVERWVQRYGEAAASAICEANNRFESSGVRMALQRVSREALLARLAEEGVGAEPHPLLPGALLVAHLAALLESRSFAEGLCYVQDASSQVLASWIAPLARGWVLDACCAPGGKLTHLLELAAGRPERLRIAALDSSRERMGRVRENLARLHLSGAWLLVGDARRLPFRGGAAPAGETAIAGWNLILLDVPCSATGMIRKYPELKWRRHAEDLPRMAAVQRDLLDEAARAVRPGGCIAYVTCSLEPEENEAQVEAFLARSPAFRRLPFRELPLPPGLGAAADALTDAVGDLCLLPGADRMGLYAALLLRQGGDPAGLPAGNPGQPDLRPSDGGAGGTPPSAPPPSRGTAGAL